MTGVEEVPGVNSQAQVDAMFARQDEGSAVDDSELLPLVEVVLTAFEKSEESG